MSQDVPTTPAVDLRASLPPIRDQGQRGTCLAFAVTAGHEVSRGGGATADDLSEEALYWGCKRTDGNWKTGTSFTSAAVALGRWGQPVEAEWPYDAGRREGVAYSPPARAGGTGWFRSGLGRVAVSLPDVRTLLDGGTPVLLGLAVFDTFYTPDAYGHVADPPAGARARGRHAVLVVGHQAGALLIRNSWGTSWAVGGYGWISDGYMGSHATSAWIIHGSSSARVGASGSTHTGESEEETYGAR